MIKSKKRILNKIMHYLYKIDERLDYIETKVINYNRSGVIGKEYKYNDFIFYIGTPFNPSYGSIFNYRNIDFKKYPHLNSLDKEELEDILNDVLIFENALKVIYKKLTNRSIISNIPINYLYSIEINDSGNYEIISNYLLDYDYNESDNMTRAEIHLSVIQHRLYDLGYGIKKFDDYLEQFGITIDSITIFSTDKYRFTENFRVMNNYNGEVYDLLDHNKFKFENNDVNDTLRVFSMFLEVIFELRNDMSMTDIVKRITKDNTLHKLEESTGVKLRRR